MSTDKTFKIKLNDCVVNARKWKAKDKIAFTDIMLYEENKSELIDILVYDCLDEKVALSKDEYKFVLSQIRTQTLGNNIKLQFNCEECNNRFDYIVDLDKTIKPIYSNIKEIHTEHYDIKLDKIKNVDFYKKVIGQAPDELDFYMRIKSINDDEGLSLEEIVDIFENMDISDFDEIFEQWEKIKFKIDDTVNIQCTHCKSEKVYQFDEVPGFFPINWLKK